MSQTCHSVQKNIKFSGKQTNLIQGQLKDDFNRNISQCAFISTPLSGKSLSFICSPETQKLNEKIQEEFSQLDDVKLNNLIYIVPIYHFPQMFNRENDKIFLKIKNPKCLRLYQTIKDNAGISFYPLMSSYQSKIVKDSGFLKLLQSILLTFYKTKKYIELNNYDNSKELMNFCLKLLNRNLHINHDDIVQQLDGCIRINPYCLLKKRSIKTSISNLLSNLLFEHKISHHLEIFHTLFNEFEKKDLDSLRRHNNQDFQFKFLKEILINKLLRIPK